MSQLRKIPQAPWSELHCIKQACGWIDPCPFWDDDGSAYMAHAYAKSRCGIKHRIDVCRMAPDASRLLDDGVEVFNNELMHPTMEGPKFYKRNGGTTSLRLRVASARAAGGAPLSQPPRPL